MLRKKLFRQPAPSKQSLVVFILSVFLLYGCQPKAAFSTDKTSGTCPLTVAFDASQSKGSGSDIASYEWDFDNNSTIDAKGVKVDHTFTLAGDYTVKLTVTDKGGKKATDTRTISVKPQEITMDFTVAYPQNGQIINKDNVSVKGKVTFPAGRSIGVVINDTPAYISSDNTFVANNVSLTEGANTLNVLMADSLGNKVEKTITITANTTGKFIKLEPNDSSGISPLETTLTLRGSFAYSEPTFTFSGPASGTVEYTEPQSGNEYKLRLTGAGVYTFNASAKDPDGNVYTDSIEIRLIDKAQLNTILNNKWDSMKTSLASGNIDNALKLFAPDSRDKYKEVFTLLQSQLPTIVTQMQSIEMVYAEGTVAKYRIIKERDLNGKKYMITSFIYFIEDPFGNWFIDEF